MTSGLNRNTNIGGDEKEIKYVITNPSKSIKLRPDDLVFVLAQNDPSSPETWDDYYFNNLKPNEESDGGADNQDVEVLVNRRNEKERDKADEQNTQNEEDKHLDPFIQQKIARQEFE